MVHYAENACFFSAPILVNDELANQIKRIRVALPGDRAEHALAPGQFFMIRDPDGDDPLIGRAFAVYDTNFSAAGNAGDVWIDLVYAVKGKLTTTLAKRTEGHNVELWGPLGNSFRTDSTQHLILVAGGIGQTPFLLQCREALGLQQFLASDGSCRATNYAEKVTLCYGARNIDAFAGVEAFRETGARVELATEDGSLGPPQRVTAPLQRILDQRDEEECRVVCCGPEPMMQAVAEIAQAAGVACDVSLETPMACGIGICFSCVAKVGDKDDWDYKRTCVEGPIFDAKQIVW